MALDNDIFTLKEIAFSALKAMAQNIHPFEYRTVFYSSTGKMEDTKMFEGVFLEKKFFEFKFTRKRTKILDTLAPFEGTTNKSKTMLMNSYAEFVKNFYPLMKIRTTKNRVFISHCGSDYEITFVEKRSIKYE